MITQTVSRSLAELARDVGFKEDTLFGLTPYGKMTSKLSIPTGDLQPYVKWNKYDSDLRLPTYFELSKWLRDQHQIRLFILEGSSDPYNYFFYMFWDKDNKGVLRESPDSFEQSDVVQEFDSYEVALEAGLKYCLSWVK